MVKMWPLRRKSIPATDRMPSDDSQNPALRAVNEEKPIADGAAHAVDPDRNEEQLAAQAILDRKELTLGAGWECTGFAFPTWRKWSILASVFIVQISMNYNASAYANAVAGITEEFGISNFQARLGQMVFLVAYVSQNIVRKVSASRY